MGSTPGGSLPDLHEVGPGVTVCWHRAATDADVALRAHVATVVKVRPDEVDVGRLCGRCGSPEHGRPWASHGVHVSLARSGPYLVTAVSTTGPVGVDVEHERDVERAWDDLAPLLDPGPRQESCHRAALWCRREAALKRAGTGFSPPHGLRGREHGRVDDLEAPGGYCAAVAYDGA